MHDRSLLGPADVTDAQLGAMVSALLGRPADLLCSRAEVVPYDMPAITTAGRYWVRGEAEVGAGVVAPYSLFVKHVQSWARSPLFSGVPEDMRAMAEASVPWRTEPLAYRSDLGDRLPDGLVMPRALGVFDLDEKSAAIWLEEVCVEPDATWDDARYARAAHLLGRMAASDAVRPLAAVGQHEFTVHHYLHGRLAGQVLPMLRTPEIWQHPLVAGAFDDLRDDLLRAAEAASALMDELAGFPLVACHGDACPNNLLVSGDGFVLIDYGFWNAMPVGFDLGQLLVGDVQVGRRDAGDLAHRDDLLVASYVEGLHAEGCDLPLAAVRRAHALHLMLFTGLSTLPFEHLEAPITPELEHVVAQRAAIARHSLRLLEETR
jgi:hypothetical protein